MQGERKRILLEIVTPYHHFFEGMVDSVVLTSRDGELGIYPGHESMVIALTPGIAHFCVEENTRYASLMEGYAEVGPTMVLVVCNAAEWPADIDVERAGRSYERSLKRYKDEASTAQIKLYARHSMRRAKTRMKLAAQYGTEKQKKALQEGHIL